MRNRNSSKNYALGVGHSGFTLVELLIVIVVIGVLSAMMMLSSTEAVSSAKAAKVISNLRNLKTATLAWYTDNVDSVVVGTTGNLKGKKGMIKDENGTIMEIKNFVEKYPSAINKYIGDDGVLLNTGRKTDKDGNKDQNDVGSLVAEGGYSIFGGNYGQDWYSVYSIGKDKSLKDKLHGRASSTGLLSYKTGGQTSTYNGTDDAVYMLIAKFSE